MVFYTTAACWMALNARALAADGRRRHGEAEPCFHAVLGGRLLARAVRRALLTLFRILLLHRPVVVVEITHKDHLDVTFKSTAEIRAAFPDGYLLFGFAAVRGELINGAYRLVPYRFEGSKQPNEDVVAVPREAIVGLGLEAKGLVAP